MFLKESIHYSNNHSLFTGKPFNQQKQVVSLFRTLKSVRKLSANLPTAPGVFLGRFFL